MVKNLDDSLLKKIDKAVNEMKNAEKEYEGCESEDGIMADSAEELLEMLMKK